MIISDFDYPFSVQVSLKQTCIENEEHKANLNLQHISFRQLKR